MFVVVCGVINLWTPSGAVSAYQDEECWHNNTAWANGTMSRHVAQSQQLISIKDWTNFVSLLLSFTMLFMIRVFEQEYLVSFRGLIIFFSLITCRSKRYLQWSAGSESTLNTANLENNWNKKLWLPQSLSSWWNWPSEYSLSLNNPTTHFNFNLPEGKTWRRPFSRHTGWYRECSKCIYQPTTVDASCDRNLWGPRHFITSYHHHK